MVSVYEDVARFLTGGPEKNGNAVSATFVFREDFAGFHGHFPGNPIVPGIAQIYAVQVALEAAEGKKTRVKETVRCKFMRPVKPGETVRVALAGEWTGGVMRCKADVTANGEPCSAMTLLLENAV